MGAPRIRFSGNRNTDIPLLPYAVSGKLHLSGSTVLTLTPATFAKFLLTNPVGSGKTLVILEIHYFSTTTLFLEFHANPTTGVPTTSRGITLIGATYTGVTTFKSDANSTAMTGGIISDVVFGSGSGVESVSRVPFMMVPGVSLGFSAQATGNQQVYLNPVWIEL